MPSSRNSRGEIIYKEGDLAQVIYLVQVGEVVIEMEVPVRAIVIEVGRLRRLFQSDHALEFALIQRITAVVADRVKATRLQLVKVALGHRT